MAEWMDQTNVPHLFAGTKGWSNISISVSAVYILNGDRQRIGRLHKNPVFFSWAPRASHDSGDHEHSPGAKWTYCVGGKYRK